MNKNIQIIPTRISGHIVCEENVIHISRTVGFEMDALAGPDLVGCIETHGVGIIAGDWLSMKE